MIRILLFCLFAGLASFTSLAPGGASAQSEATAPDYDIWRATATRAEEAIETGRASDTALEELREQLVGWRVAFTAAQLINADRISTLETQIAALGSIPGDGETEPEEIAAQRVELNELLAIVRTPVLNAEVAYQRADGLISQVDKLLRGRQTDELLELLPTPLNPANWGEGIITLYQSLSALRGEVVTAWQNPVQRTESWRDLPTTLIFLVLAIALLVRGGHWVESLSLWLQSHQKVAWRWTLGFVISLGQIALPLLGVYCLVEAITSTGLIGLRGEILLASVLPAGFAFYVARWIGLRVFPRAAHRVPYLALSAEQRAEGRWYCASLGLLFAADTLLNSLVLIDTYSAAATVVLSFPILVLIALITFRIGQIMVAHYKREAADEDGASYRTRIIRLIGRAAMAASAVGVALGAIGYFAAANMLVYPTAMTLGLISFVFILQRLVSEVYALLTGAENNTSDALFPVLAGFIIVVLASPVLALIWGVRTSALAELWTKFMDGVALGDARISPANFLTFAIIFTVGYILTRLLQSALRTSVLPRTKLDVGGRNAIVSGTGYTGIFVAALVAITGAGIDLSSLAIVAGALSVGIGFGLQNIVSNFVSGIILLIERPISEGDWIDVGGNSGYVRDISVRSTRIETFDRADVIVPNADLISGVVKNMTKGSLTGRVIVPVGVAYGNDTKRVEAILQEIAEAHPMVVLNPPPGVVFQGFGADSLDFEIRAILRDVNWMLSVKSDMNHEIARRFKEEDIEIPFAQRDIWIRNPEALAGQGETQSAPPSEPEAGKTSATAEIDFSMPQSHQGDGDE